MLLCMPEADDWQLEKNYIRQICEDLYNEHLQEVHQYKGTLNAQIYRDAKKKFRRAKNEFKRGWRSKDDFGREMEARQYFGMPPDRRMPGTYKHMRPGVLR